MTVKELLIKILEETGVDLTLLVKIDGGYPIAFEECFEVKKGKGFLLFKRIKKSGCN